MRFLISIIVLSLCAIAPPAQAQLTPDARALLTRSGGAALASDSLRLEGTESRVVVSPANRATASASFLLLRAHGRERFETKSGDGTTLLIAGETGVRRYDSATNSYTHTPSADTPENDPFARIQFGRDPANFHNARLEREEKMDFGNQQVPCYVVRASYDSMPGNASAWEVVRTVWIAKSTNLVLRDTWEYATNALATLALGKSSITTDYTVIEPGVALADDLFLFHPPQGSREVSDTMSVRLPPSTDFHLPAEPVPVRRIQPEYTAEARAAGLQGVVSLYVEVARDGKPSTVEVMQGLGLGLDESAVDAVGRWEYAGPPGTFEVQIPFSLDPPAVWSVSGEHYRSTDPNAKWYGDIARPVPTHYVAPNAAACTLPDTLAVRMTVTKDGTVRDVYLQRGTAGAAADAAMKAAEGWRFKPAKGNGQAIDMQAGVELLCTPAAAATKTAEGSVAYPVGGRATPPVLLTKTEPEYSDAARRAKLEGSAMLYVQIDPSGAATHIHVVRSLGRGLDRKAMEAVKQWRFKPGSIGGKPVTVEATIEVNFRLL